MEKPIIAFKNVSVEYKAYKKNRDVLAGELLGLKRGLVQPVLDNISFAIYKGEKVALIGNNGRERDVIVELIAGLTHHTRGKIAVKGKIAYAIAFSAGFDLAMDVFDNIELKGYMMGWTKSKVKECKYRIIEKSGLFTKRKYKLKDLKSTDVSRLGFYMFAEETDADIYVIGCPLLVGDNTQKKECMDVLKQLTGGPDKTLVIANKYMEYANRLCNRAIAFNDKKMVYDGGVKETVKYFLTNFKQKPEK